MQMFHIPDTATETYLERLAENISRQLEKTQNPKQRVQMKSMLIEVQKRLVAARHKTEHLPVRDVPDNLEVLELTDMMEEEQATVEFVSGGVPVPAAEPTEEAEADILELTELHQENVLPLSAELADLSEKEQVIIKERLRLAMERQREAAPSESEANLLSKVVQEINEQPLLDHTDLSTEQQEHLKERLKGILHKFQNRSAISDLLDEDSTPRVTITRWYQLSPEQQRLIAEGIAAPDGQDLELVPPPPDKPEEKYEFRPLTNDKMFIEVCQKVSQGEPVDLLQALKLSDREQDLVNALAMHLSSYKGLKKQQIFEMQHLTARSIYELDLIFKTYHIQGYLKAELTNLYNRLLNLRGRFSVLQH
jgi:hypothetical protein